MKSDRVTLKIPRQLYNRLHRILEGSSFRSVNEFVVYVLRDLLAGHDRAVDAPLTSREIEVIRERLRNLGYLE